MFFLQGERVAINLDIDSYNEGEDVLFGTVSSCKAKDENNPISFISNPILTVVIGDNGKTYYSLQFSMQSVQSPNTFMNVYTFKRILELKRNEINKELDILKDYENIYMESLTNRFKLGINFEKVKKDYTDFILKNMDRLRNTNNAITYLTVVYTKHFDPNFIPPNNNSSQKDEPWDGFYDDDDDDDDGDEI